MQSSNTDADGYNELIIESMGDVGGSNNKPSPNGIYHEDDDDSPQLRTNNPRRKLSGGTSFREVKIGSIQRQSLV